MHAFFLTRTSSDLEQPRRRGLCAGGAVSLRVTPTTHPQWLLDFGLTLCMLTTASGGVRGDRLAGVSRPSLAGRFRLPVLGNPVAQFVAVEAAGTADLVTREPARGGLIVDPVLVHSEQLGDLAGGHHRLHRGSFSDRGRRIANMDRNARIGRVLSV